MAEDYSVDLAKIRYERALELYSEAENLINGESYKSANNRAYYAAEKWNSFVQSPIMMIFIWLSKKMP